MRIVNYAYKHSDTEYSDHHQIDGLSREEYATRYYINMFRDEFAKIDCSKKTAVLYAGGANLHQMEGRNVGKIDWKKFSTIPPADTTMIIKEVTATLIHKYIGTLSEPLCVTYANINSNSCASSMHSIYEAKQLIDNGTVEQVVIIAEERIMFNTIRIFNEHKIPVKTADGFAMMVFDSGSDGMQITDAKWEYVYNRNPFYSSSDGYSKVYDDDCDVVKVHGTGTTQNTEAENAVVGSKEQLMYKCDIGHTQGVSALLEICMMLDEKKKYNTMLAMASGLGGFYGSCKIKRQE